MAEYIVIPGECHLTKEEFLETLILRKGHDYNGAYLVLQAPILLFAEENGSFTEEDKKLFKNASSALNHIQNVNQAIETLTTGKINYQQFNVTDPIQDMLKFIVTKHANLDDIISLSCEGNIPILISRTVLYQQIYSFVNNVFKSFPINAINKTIDISVRKYDLEQKEIQYLGQKGKNLTSGSPFVEVSVRDNGIGIEEKRLSKIFERGHSTRGTKGIGLALSRKSAEMLCDYIHVESIPNQGSTFNLRFHQNGGLI